MNHLHRSPPRSARLVAALCAALVLVLSVLAVCPAAHEWAHGHSRYAAQGANVGPAHNHPAADPDDDGCIVTLFAHGLVPAMVFTALAIALLRLIASVARPREALCLPAPRYWLPPLCGPPRS